MRGNTTVITNHELDLIGRAVAETPPHPEPVPGPGPEGGDDEAEREPVPTH